MSRRCCCCGHVTRADARLCVPCRNRAIRAGLDPASVQPVQAAWVIDAALTTWWWAQAERAA